MLRFGLLLSFFAVFLQVCVFLQTLLPQKYQISPVCETITLALLQQQHNTLSHADAEHSHHHDTSHAHMHHDTHTDQIRTHQHDSSHQCQYCTVYANLVLPPNTDLKEVLVKINVQLIWLQQQFAHVYFVLQRLFLIPQGRAPPVLTSSSIF